MITDSANILNADRIEKLRVILESEQKRPVSTAVAAMIGRDLICFFENFNESLQITK